TPRATVFVSAVPPPADPATLSRTRLGRRRGDLEVTERARLREVAVRVFCVHDDLGARGDFLVRPADPLPPIGRELHRLSADDLEVRARDRLGRVDRVLDPPRVGVALRP